MMKYRTEKNRARRKIGTIPVLVLLILLTACGSERPKISLTFVRGHKNSVMIDGAQVPLVSIYTVYTNSSGVPVVPADFLDVRAVQNGKDLQSVIVAMRPSDEYRPCNKVVQSGETVNVIWSFMLADDSPVEVDMDTGSGTEHFEIAV